MKQMKAEDALFVSYNVKRWQRAAFQKGGMRVKRKCAVWLLVLLVLVMHSVFAGSAWDSKAFSENESYDWTSDTGGWGCGWGDDELGDESVPLYVLCGLAAAAAAGAVILHKRRVRVG